MTTGYYHKELEYVELRRPEVTNDGVTSVSVEKDVMSEPNTEILSHLKTP